VEEMAEEAVAEADWAAVGLEWQEVRSGAGL
jgi:hypothetical protein